MLLLEGGNKVIAMEVLLLDKNVPLYIMQENHIFSISRY